VKNLKKVTKIAIKSSELGQKKTDKSVEIFGVAIVGTRKSEVLKKIWLQRKEMLHVATVNPEYIMEARQNQKFKQVLSQCLTVADGHGVMWAHQVRSEKDEVIVERISGVELVDEILSHASTKNEKVFLLGAASGVAEMAAKEMSKKYPGLQISWYEGAKTVRVEKNEEASMTIAKINSICPDYLLVAYGSPHQDLWIEENRPYLRVRVALGVGGTLDEWAGVVSLCPAWIDRLGFKWVWRVVHEPWRWKRIARALQFGWLVLWMRFKEIF
jgi:N-acetylglucosaminyldiphosphoundecaprenol N-acetyl-beta-D-mannosaminyltransferase